MPAAKCGHAGELVEKQITELQVTPLPNSWLTCQALPC
jgi:hypothetical protein